MTGGNSDATASTNQAVGGVLFLFVLVILMALCMDTPVVQQGNPIPNWVMSIVPDPALDVGFSGTSDGINAINNNCVHRHRRGAFETDGARWGAALSKGKHVFEIYWPSGHRGTMATVGVGTEDAPLFVKPKDSLVGCNGFSWGLDIARKRLLHRGEMLGTMPRGGVVPDKFYMYVDCDGGTLGFGTDHAYWGAPINIPRAKFPVYAMIGSLCENSQITMIYRGSENKNMAPGNITAVTVPSTGPGGQVQVTVVNPGNLPPAYGAEQSGPPEGQSETYVAPVKVSG
ncbi:protein gustavus-like isoform X2 [Mercenaria mercenaria]|uniref:protein gustavus-like isoform X2 n=1 Tax=Mercenaria mercenaria TaxID=6596 RepID=UPI00234F25D1|nr:protein gustavus-like isoform X2 [Mercenaria mercenaria]